MNRCRLNSFLWDQIDHKGLSRNDRLNNLNASTIIQLVYYAARPIFTLKCLILLMLYLLRNLMCNFLIWHRKQVIIPYRQKDKEAWRLEPRNKSCKMMFFIRKIFSSFRASLLITFYSILCTKFVAWILLIENFMYYVQPN